MPLTPEGWTLLKTWEGCRLSAYPDPASGGAPWTIGYGHTGPDVVPGRTITQQQADAFLQTDVADAACALERLLPGVSLLPRQRDALISFCFNVGVGALETSTLRKRLTGGRWRSLTSTGRSGRLRCPAARAHHVVSPALAAADEVLTMGDQALVQLAGEHGDAVHPRVMPKPVAGHAGLAAAGLEQHVLLQVWPALRRIKRLRRCSNATNSDPHHPIQCVRLY